MSVNGKVKKGQKFDDLVGTRMANRCPWVESRVQVEYLALGRNPETVYSFRRNVNDFEMSKKYYRCPVYDTLWVICTVTLSYFITLLFIDN